MHTPRPCFCIIRTKVAYTSAVDGPHPHWTHASLSPLAAPGCIGIKVPLKRTALAHTINSLDTMLSHLEGRLVQQRTALNTEVYMSFFEA